MKAMKSIFKKRNFLIIVCSGFLFLSALILAPPAYAVGASVGITNPGQVSEGTQSSVTFTISGSEAINVQGSVSVSGGGTLAGLSAPNANGASFATIDANGAAAWSGTITFNVVSADPVIISVSGIAAAINTESGKTEYGGSISIPVYSKAAQEADAAAAASIAASQAEAERAAQASRDAEAAIAASIAAVEASKQAEIDASIAAEQSSIQASEAESESIENSKIAESVSIEESSKLESLSIEESIEEVSRSEAEESMSIEESISMSESEVEKTRAFEVKEDFFVPWEYEGERGRFLFAVADTNVEPPEGFTMTDLIINKQYIWAAQSKDTAAHTYLVYGTYDEDKDAAFYYYDADTGRLFSYDNLNSTTDNRAVRSETDEEAEEAAVKGGITPGRAVLFTILGAIGGAAIFGLVLYLLKYLKERDENSEDDEELLSAPVITGVSVYGDSDEIDEIPVESVQEASVDETMKVLFGTIPEETESLPIEEKDAEEEDQELPIEESDVEYGDNIEGVDFEIDAIPPEEIESLPEEAAETFDAAAEEASAYVGESAYVEENVPEDVEVIPEDIDAEAAADNEFMKAIQDTQMSSPKEAAAVSEDALPDDVDIITEDSNESLEKFFNNE